MATVSLTRNSTLPSIADRADFHNLIDTATGTISAITGADIDSIETNGKVSGSALYDLSDTPNSVGAFPAVNVVQSLASGYYPYYNGTNLACRGITEADVPTLSSYGKVSGTAVSYLTSLATSAGVIPTANAPSINSLVPAMASANGYYLTNNGSAVSWGAVSQSKMFGGMLTTAASATFKMAGAVMPFSGTIRNLYVYRDNTAGSFVYTIYKNGVATEITCTVPDETGNDTTHTVAVVAGDYIYVELTSNSTTSMTSYVGFEIA